MNVCPLQSDDMAGSFVQTCLVVKASCFLGGSRQWTRCTGLDVRPGSRCVALRTLCRFAVTMAAVRYPKLQNLEVVRSQSQVFICRSQARHLQQLGTYVPESLTGMETGDKIWFQIQSTPSYPCFWAHLFDRGT